jgi:hypothetical protein
MYNRMYTTMVYMLAKIFGEKIVNLFAEKIHIVPLQRTPSVIKHFH